MTEYCFSRLISEHELSTLGEAAIKQRMLAAIFDARGELLPTLVDGETHIVKVEFNYGVNCPMVDRNAPWRMIPAPFYGNDVQQWTVRCTSDVVPRRTVQLEVVDYTAMPLSTLVLSAAGELRSRWRWRTRSVKSFFDWLEKAQGWR